MKKIFITVLVLFVSMFTLSGVCVLHADDATSASVARDIKILKILNWFEVSNDQAQKLIPIIDQGCKERLKSLNAIRNALLQGKNYGELKDTYIKNLDTTDAETVKKIRGVLTAPSQTEKAQMLFDLVTPDELKMTLVGGLSLLTMMQKRTGMLRDLGILEIPDHLTQVILEPAGAMALAEIVRMQNMVKEKIIQPRTVQLLQEKVAAMPAAQ